jgi:arginine utilization regulatory protein
MGQNRNMSVGNGFQSNISSLDSDEMPPLDEYLEKIELNLIKDALKKTNHNISAAARKLEISRQSLQYKLKKYNLKDN